MTTLLIGIVIGSSAVLWYKRGVERQEKYALQLRASQLLQRGVVERDYTKPTPSPYPIHF